jgi:hypothetical protein
LKQVAALLFLALLTIAVLLFITNPELLENIWLWIVGFIGYIVVILEKGFKAVASAFQSQPTPATPLPAAEPAAPSKPTTPNIDELEKQIRHLEDKLRRETLSGEALSSSTVTVLRYLDDGQTSLGLLFLKNRFFAYTLEDTFREDKVAGQTRVPAGTYQLKFNPTLTPLTKNYQKRFPWFTYHLEIEDIKGFDNVYVHIGNTHQDTQGCILIADGVTTTSPEKMITDSRRAFQRFYQKISALLQVGEKVSIRILDENWIEQAKLQPI